MQVKTISGMTKAELIEYAQAQAAVISRHEDKARELIKDNQEIQRSYNELTTRLDEVKREMFFHRTNSLDLLQVVKSLASKLESM